ncbi:MAG: ABC transporter ATPase [Bacteroidetes bacterium]|nr:ABC transporter ATPase [Bacteroidota bacterium]
MVTFNEMPNRSKVWIYQSDRNFTAFEIDEIRKKAALFLLDWSSHGNMMLATIDIVYNRFLIVLVDEETASASGCGIDKSVRFIQQIEKDYLINLFDRLLVTFRDEHGVIRGTKLQEFEQLVEKGALNADTIVFNNLLGTKEEMSTKWEVAIKNSWHARMLLV